MRDVEQASQTVGARCQQGRRSCRVEADAQYIFAVESTYCPIAALVAGTDATRRGRRELHAGGGTTANSVSAHRGSTSELDHRCTARSRRFSWLLQSAATPSRPQDTRCGAAADVLWIGIPSACPAPPASTTRPPHAGHRPQSRGVERAHETAGCGHRGDGGPTPPRSGARTQQISPRRPR